MSVGLGVGDAVGDGAGAWVVGVIGDGGGGNVATGIENCLVA